MNFFAEREELIMSELEIAASNVKKAFKIALVNQEMSQQQLAELLNTTPAQVSRALAGNTTPKDIAIQKAAAKILQIQI